MSSKKNWGSFYVCAGLLVLSSPVMAMDDKPELQKGDAFFCKGFGRKESFCVLVKPTKEEGWEKSAYGIVSQELYQAKTLDKPQTFNQLASVAKNTLPNIPYPFNTALLKAAQLISRQL